MLDSFLSNRANEYQHAALSMSDRAVAQFDTRPPDLTLVKDGKGSSYTKVAVLYLGKHRSWCAKTPTMKKAPISTDILRLTRKILRGVLNRHRKPAMTNLQMQLDGKVASIEAGEDSRFPYWLKLATLQTGKPILIPIRSNAYYESVPGIRKPFVQGNLAPDRLSFGFVKDVVATG
jgi:hypothetical protein